MLYINLIAQNKENKLFVTSFIIVMVGALQFFFPTNQKVCTSEFQP